MAEHNFSVENTLSQLLELKKYHSLRDILSTMNPADVAAVFDDMAESQLPLLFCAKSTPSNCICMIYPSANLRFAVQIL